MAFRAAVGLAWTGTAAWWVAPLVSGLGPRWQAFAWIPDWTWMLVVLLPSVVGLALARCIRRRRVLWALIAGLAVVPPGVGMLVRDVGWTESPPSPALRIVFLNAQDPPAGAVDAELDVLLGLDADLVVVVNPGWLPPTWRARQTSGPESREMPAWSIQWRSPVMVASRHGPSVLRTLVSNRGVRGIRLEPPEVVAKAFGDRPWLVVDLPSDPAIDRDQVATSLIEGLRRGGVQRLDDFGLVLGDFNMTPRTPALIRLRAGLVDLVSTCGDGWMATWPREHPVLRIDHIFGTTNGAARVSTFDPEWGGHRGFVLEVTRD